MKRYIHIFLTLFAVISFISCGDIVDSEENILKTPLPDDDYDVYGWRIQKTDYGNNLYSVFFIDDDTGWIVGENGIILKTHDQGKEWNMIANTNSLGGDKGLNDVFFISATNGWAVGESGRVIKTTNGGKSWSEKILQPAFNIKNVCFYDAYNGLLGGDGEYLYVTDDGGNTWSKMPELIAADVDDIHANGNIFVIVGSNRLIARTKENESGYSIKSFSGFDETEYKSVFFYDENYAAIASDEAILLTFDNGQHWQENKNEEFGQLQDIVITSTFRAWAVGKNGSIFFSPDMGTTWNRQYSGYYENLNSVYFPNDSTGWAVGDNGMILNTRNRGIMKDTVKTFF